MGYNALTPEQNQAWVDQNLDSVMQRMTFAAGNGLVMPYRIFLPPAYDKGEPIPEDVPIAESSRG